LCESEANDRIEGVEAWVKQIGFYEALFGVGFKSKARLKWLLKITTKLEPNTELE